MTHLRDILAYTAPVSSGIGLWLWALGIPGAEQLLRARLCPT